MGYMATDVQQGKPQLVRDMKNVLAAVIEMSRMASAGDAVNRSPNTIARKPP